MSNVAMKFFPIDSKLGYLQITVDLDAQDQEALGDVDEALAIMSALQTLYMTAVLNFGGEVKINQLLHDTLMEHGEAAREQVESLEDTDE